MNCGFSRAASELAIASPGCKHDFSMQDTNTAYTDIRDAVRRIPRAEYHRDANQRRGYPETFVEALTGAGWLAALIPRNRAAGAWASAKPR